ncbi:MAG: DUF697 domain-containing protein [Actinobacteria bacterium]|nr:DUF697 domain-containing protein [Actinomycetota bacterium]MBV8598333.1 DUF697 domain-containing protein [Actinomycetota bacterium]
MRVRPGAARTVAVDGAPQLVPILVRALRAGGSPGAVVEGSLANAAILVWVGEPDEAKLREASIARIPIVAVTDADHVPYVLATDIVHVPAGQGFPTDAIARVVARRLGDDAPAIAAQLPGLRRAVVDALIESSARKNAVLAAGLVVPGVDMPVLTLAQVRLVMRIAQAYGLEVGRERALEVLGVVGAGFGLRALAREALDFVPVAGWALKGAIAYSGTKAVGEAARRYFEQSVRPGS